MVRARTALSCRLAVKSLIIVTTLAALLVTACSASAQRVDAPTSPEPVASATVAAVEDPLGRPTRARLVTVGGTFTYGRYVLRRDTWPRQLERMLRPVAALDLVRNLGQSGFTSQQVIEEQLELIETYQPDIITLQIGANDVLIPSITMAEYRANIEIILDALLLIVPSHRILALTTPDFSLTSWGTIAPIRTEHVAEANRILAEATAARGIELVDIGSISDRVPFDPSLVLPNGFDPSEKQYAGWVELIAPRVRAALAQPSP